MKFALCNELCAGWTLDDTFGLAAQCGYDGVALAPFTLGKPVTEIGATRRRQIRKAAAVHGVEITGLYSLLVAPGGLHINHTDDGVRERTRGYCEALIHFCADIGGTRMVIGSPKQRNALPGENMAGTWARSVRFLRSIAPVAGECGVILCIDPLPARETGFVNTAEEAVRLIREVDHPNFRLALDGDAMAAEARPVRELVRAAGGQLAHVRVGGGGTDPRRGNGSGPAALVEALRAIGYSDWVALRIVEASPEPGTIARAALADIRETMGGAA